jgi:hypothetical protein
VFRLLLIDNNKEPQTPPSAINNLGLVCVGVLCCCRFKRSRKDPQSSYEEGGLLITHVQAHLRLTGPDQSEQRIDDPGGQLINQPLDQVVGHQLFLIVLDNDASSPRRCDMDE